MTLIQANSLAGPQDFPGYIWDFQTDRYVYDPQKMDRQYPVPPPIDAPIGAWNSGSITTPIQEKKQMFVINIVRTKAGYVGQVAYSDRIVWESFAFYQGATIDDTFVRPAELAQRSAKNAIDVALDNVFKEIPSV